MTPEYPLPEFTRSLRALAVASAPDSDHDVVFAPLLEARRAAHRATSLDQQLAAFDAPRLERGWRGAIATLAERRFPKSLPDRRAVAAELELLARPLWARVESLKAAAERTKLARSDAKRDAWTAWVAELQLLFRAADAWWERCQ
ncbi:MAG TPA: hypothetical protein PK788_10070 [Gemmatimonadaceae bacterium]|nr:hypothetical protein [Gemmatimonadaceae bacterium]